MANHENLFHTIAANICNKPEHLNHEDCFSLSDNPLCQNHGNCRIFEKTDQQLDYVSHSKDMDSLLKACPGSGKTEVVGLKAAYEIKRWSDTNSGIAILTFTNNAASEVAERISQFTGIRGTGYPHFIGTIDSWLHGYIANPFTHILTKYKGRDGDKSLRVVDTQEQGDWLHSFKVPSPYLSAKNRRSIIFANNYHFDIENSIFVFRPQGAFQWISHEEYFHCDQFQEFCSDKPWLTMPKFTEGFWKIKKSFWEAGFCTYQDIELLCLQILSDPNIKVGSVISKRFPTIIIDECQDLSYIQLQLLEKLKMNGSKLHFVGDLNQGIYSFKKVFPQTVAAFAKQHSFTEYYLQENFRSVQAIVDMCGKICQQGNITGRTLTTQTPTPCVLFTYSAKQVSFLPFHFSNYLSSKGFDPDKSAILARGRRLIESLRPGLLEGKFHKGELPVRALFLWNTGDWDLQKAALKLFGKFIANHFYKNKKHDSKNQYCPESISAKIQWRTFLAQLLNRMNTDKGLKELDQTWAQWSMEFKNFFPGILDEAVDNNEIKLDTSEFSYRTPNGKASLKLRQYVESSLDRPEEKSNIRVTTIHQVKGETLDAVMLVSAPDRRGGTGGYWSEWLDPSVDDGEHTRFAYVASSRPRKLLAWAIPEKDKNQIAALEGLGFVYTSLSNEDNDHH